MEQTCKLYVEHKAARQRSDDVVMQRCRSNSSTLRRCASGGRSPHRQSMRLDVYSQIPPVSTCTPSSGEGKITTHFSLT